MRFLLACSYNNIFTPFYALINFWLIYAPQHGIMYKGGYFMCSGVKIIGVIMFFMGLGMVLGIIIPLSTFILALVLICAGLAILMN